MVAVPHDLLHLVRARHFVVGVVKFGWVLQSELALLLAFVAAQNSLKLFAENSVCPK